MIKKNAPDLVCNCPDTGTRIRHAGHKRIAVTMVAAAIALVSQQVCAVSVDAGDYDYVPAGTRLGLLYYQYSSGDTLYSGGAGFPTMRACAPRWGF